MHLNDGINLDPLHDLTSIPQLRGMGSQGAFLRTHKKKTYIDLNLRAVGKG